MNAKNDPRELTDEQMVQLVSNALFVAGMEMGQDGDHWPAIRDTVQRIKKDWEKLKIERAVQEEMKIHLYAHLEEMERALPLCSPEEREQAQPKLQQLREIYDAYFTETKENVLYLEDADMPMHLRRAEIILDTLELVDVEPEKI